MLAGRLTMSLPKALKTLESVRQLGPMEEI